MKSPDDIKKGLECCSEDGCKKCPYWEDCHMADGFSELAGDALALIQQLQEDLQLEKKRTDALAMELAVLKNAKKQLEDHLREATKKVKQIEVERDAMKEALGLMVYQYCVSGTELDHRYMCAGETAFRVLGLEQYGDTRTLESWLFPECQDKEE